jgi:multisubunit Na+/H+ antiporter MnhF subunit
MQYLEPIRAAHSDAKALEELYQEARRDHMEEEFARDVLALYQGAPDNLLYAAWHYRLQPGPVAPSVAPLAAVETPTRLVEATKSTNWLLAIPCGLIAGVIVWWLTGRSFFAGAQSIDQGLSIALAIAPIEAFFAIAFLMLTSRKHWIQSLLAVAGMAGLYFYVTGFTNVQNANPNAVAGQYPILMMLHIPLLAWMGLKRDNPGRFAFLAKSLEVLITGSIYGAGALVFSGITMGLFAALNVKFSEAVMRLLTAGVGGAIPVLAVATVYDPHLSPYEQRFEEGLGKLISILMRLLLPLTLLVLSIYVVFIPFNFQAPFRSRDLLIVYNAMLFAIMGLLIGATPVRRPEPSSGYAKALRWGILVLVILATVVSLYAMSAIVYRTLQGALTPNRLTVIGWNTINIAILIFLMVKLFKSGQERWVEAVHTAIGTGAMAYIAWTTLLILALPLLFR